ncbi:hypothetical protein [Sulfitobacter sp. R18_1]|nr:hypothetical protein [Sulfitobacter sp. R18_1]MBO9428280.1 hypothetical protein [Sulfitobacter sp. R18_1]
MPRKDAAMILKAAGATDLQTSQFLGARDDISAETVAAAVPVLTEKNNS